MSKKSKLDQELETLAAINDGVNRSLGSSVSSAGVAVALTPALGPLSSLVPAELPAHVADELIVKFSSDLSGAGREKGIEKAVAAIGGAVREFIPSGPQDTEPAVARVSVGNGLTLEKAIEILNRLPEVEGAEHNWIYNTQATSNDFYYTGNSLWGMYGDDPSVGTYGNAFGSQADEAWAKGYTGSTKVVAGVIDSGIDYRHPDLYLNIWLNQSEIKNLTFFSLIKDTDSDGLITFRDLNDSVNRNNSSLNTKYIRDYNNNTYIDAGDLLDLNSGWEDLQDNDGNGRVDDLIGWDFVNNDNDPLDDNQHGTHVAGTIGGLGNNSVGVAGVAWNAQLMALKFLSFKGSGSLDNALKAVDYYTDASKAGTGEFFIGTNNSWGGGGYSSTLLDAIVRAAQADLLFVAAAGNSTSNNDAAGSYPSNYDTSARAGFDAVVAVAALTSSGSLASYSNYGANTVDLGAPGSGIWSSVPNGGYASLSGTSMATPHVMGALTVLAAAFPNLSASQLRSLLLGNTVATSSLVGKTLTGGRLDVDKMMSSAVLLPESSDATPPSVVITLSDNNLLVGESATVTFTFSESVSDFSLSDIVLSNVPGSLSNLTANVNSTIFTATFTPTPEVKDDVNVIEVLAQSYQDLAGNSGLRGVSGNFAVNTITPTQGITVWGATGSESIFGTPGNDRLAGVLSSGTTSSAMGKGTIDRLWGYEGADVFLLGDIRGRFYDDGASTNAGTGDYGLIMDYSQAQGDKIQLAAGTYFFRDVTLSGGVKGAGIYFDSNRSLLWDKLDELIGVVGGVSFSSLSGADVVWA